MRMPEVGVLLVGRIMGHRPALKFEGGGEIEGTKYAVLAGDGATEVKVLNSSLPEVGYLEVGSEVAWIVRYGASSAGVFCSFQALARPEHLDAAASVIGVSAPASSK